MACLWDELINLPAPQSAQQICITESSVQQRTTSNTDPLLHPQVPRFCVTQHVPCQVTGNRVWQGEVCCGMVAKYIKEGEIKSHFKQNTAQGTSVLLGGGWDPQDSLQTAIQFLSFRARNVNSTHEWQKVPGNAVTLPLKSAKKQGRGNSTTLSPAPLHPQAKGRRPNKKLS